MQAQNQSSHFATRLRLIMLRPGQTPSNYHRFSRAFGGSILLLLLFSSLSLGSIEANQQINAVTIKPTKIDITSSTQKPDYAKPFQDQQVLFMPKPGAKKTKPTSQLAPLTPSLLVKDTIPTKSVEHIVKIAMFRDKTLFLGSNVTIGMSITGFLDEQILVSSTDVEITPIGKGKFNVLATRIGKAMIVVEAPNFRQEIEFEVVYHDPIATLGEAGIIGGEINISALRALKNIELKQPANFPEVKCEILGFSCIYVPYQKDPIQSINPGGLFVPNVLNIFQQAEVNSQFIFDNIRVRCPGDETGRKINNIAVKVVADPEKE